MPDPAPPPPEYAALIETIRANVDDAAPRLIASDWIEEHDDGRWAGRVEFIRKQAYANRDWWLDPAVRVVRPHGWFDTPMSWQARDEADPDLFHPRGGDWPDDPLVIAAALIPPLDPGQTVSPLRVEWGRGFVTDVFLEGRTRTNNKSVNLTLPEFLDFVWPWQPVQRLYLCSPPMLLSGADERGREYVVIQGRDRSVRLWLDEVRHPEGEPGADWAEAAVDHMIRTRAPGLLVNYTYLSPGHFLNAPYFAARRRGA